MANTLTIVFRGLLVIHQLKVSGKPNIFEIGILPEHHHHVPRILKIRNGVLESTFLLDEEIAQKPGIWTLKIDRPAKMCVTTRQSDTTSDKVNRSSPPIPDDFRLILNLANSEFPYGSLTGKLKLDILPVVVQVPSGDFYTRLQSELVDRKEHPNGDPSPFGHYAGVMGCDISLNGTGATLIGPGTSAPEIFRFDSEPNVIYEFSNSPPDIEMHPQPPPGHFLHYYDLFKDASVKKFDFVLPVPSRPGGGPNPAVCGKIYTGETSESLKP